MTIKRTAEDIEDLFVYSIKIPINEDVKNFLKSCLTEYDGLAANASLKTYLTFKNESLHQVINNIRNYFEKEVINLVLAREESLFDSIVYNWKKFNSNLDYFNRLI